MTPYRTLGGLWEDWVRDGIPGDYSAERLTEMRRAFYCGSGAVLAILSAALKEEDPAAALQDVLESMRQEGRAFVAQWDKESPRPKSG